MNIVLFIATALIWGSTWLAIQFQLGVVPPIWSLTYRFGASSLLLLTYCLLRKKSLRFSKEQHAWIALQAFFMFTISYILFYFTSAYFVSGIVAILFASVLFWNMINGLIILGTPLALRTITGSLCGLIGLICIMWAEILRLDSHDFWYLMEGLALGLVAAFCASLGQTISILNSRRGLPLTQINAYGYAYATLFMTIFAALTGTPPTIDLSYAYLGSLCYLTILGTVVAFLCYLTLINRMGADKGGYVFILTPLIALSLSSFYEEFNASNMTFVGLILIVTGNLLIMIQSKSPTRLPQPANQLPSTQKNRHA